MGLWRNLYYILGIEYIGRVEQKQIQRQHGLKYLCLSEMHEKGYNKILKKEIFINRIVYKNRMKNIIKKKLKKNC